MNCDIESLGFKAAGELQARLSWQIDIENLFAMVAIKVAVLAHVWAKSGRATLQGNLPDDTAFDQGVEAIVNRRHGNVGHGGLGADKDLLGGGMIALVQQDVVDLLALGGESEAPGGEAFVQGITHFFVSNRSH